MKRFFGTNLVVILLLTYVGAPISRAANLADCIVVSSAGIKESFFEKVYEVTLKNICGESFKESLNYTGVSFYADYSTVNPEKDTIFYLQPYGSTYSFKLRDLKSGTYRPYLRLFVPKDYSNKTVNLPGFTIADPIECVGYLRDRFIAESFSKTLTITLKNLCPTLSSREFTNLQLQLDIPGYYGFISSKNVYILDTYGTDFQFELSDIKAGNYFPVLNVKDSNFKSKRISLSPIRIFSTPAPTPLPSKTASGIPSESTSKLCSVTKNLKEQCMEAPNFKLEFCSSLKNGQLQEKVGNTWVDLWKIKGIRYSTSCRSTANPYLISVNGTSTTQNVTSLRIVFTKTKKVSSYIQKFELINR